MKPPQYYSEWSTLLHKLKASNQEDEEIIRSLEQGRIDWSAGVADKIVDAMFGVIQFKLQETTRLFQLQLNNSCHNDTDVIAAIISARRRFEHAYRLCRLSIFPDEVRDSLQDIVDKYIKDTQEALLDSAKHDRTGQLGYAIKYNSFIPQQSNSEAAAASESIQPINSQIKSRRRVLL